MRGVRQLVAERSALAVAVGASVILAVIMLGAYSAANRVGIDFSVYWLTANRPVSWAYELRSSYPFPYAPTMLLWIKPLSIVGFWPAFLFWVVLSAIAFYGVCRDQLTAQESLLALISPPVIFCLILGQVSVALAALTLWALGTKNRIPAGLALAAVASIKPQLVIMAPLLLLLRADWRALVSAGLAFVIIIVAAVILFGAQPWLEWIGSFENFRAVLHDDGKMKAALTPAATAERVGLPPLPFLLLGAAFGSWLVYRCRNLGPVEATAAVTAGSIFASPYALHYDLAAIVPFFAIEVFRGRIWAAVAVSGLLQPLPMALTAFGLMMKKKQSTQAPVLERRI